MKSPFIDERTIGIGILKERQAGRPVAVDDGEYARWRHDLVKLVDCNSLIVTASVTESLYDRLVIGAPVPGYPPETWIFGPTRGASRSTSHARESQPTMPLPRRSTAGSAPSA